MLPARSILRNQAAGAVDLVVLSYDERFLRRKRLTCESGASFMVDLGETTSLNDGDAFVLDDGRKIAVKAADEPVVIVTGPLPRLAWHIGNRHTPCQVAEGYLVIRRDHVLEAMLRQRPDARLDRTVTRDQIRKIAATSITDLLQKLPTTQGGTPESAARASHLTPALHATTGSGHVTEPTQPDAGG